MSASDFPRGFFVEDLRQKPSRPAFYNLETHQVEPFNFKQAYSNFIDVVWDHDHGRVFFSARLTAKDPYRVYLKTWPDGDEKVIYENPLGPFRFLLSPDGRRMVLQVMGPSAWPILALHDWEKQETVLLGQGFSPDWSPDGQRVLFLQIPGSLPTWLAEYRVDTDTSTLLMKDPVAEAVYADDPNLIILKTVKQSKKCDEFQLWNSKLGTYEPYSKPVNQKKSSKACVSQREINSFPGHQFFYFKESASSTELDEQTMVIADPHGGRYQTLAKEDWDPRATAVETTTLVIGENPLYVMSADGTGGRTEVPDASFIRYER